MSTTARLTFTRATRGDEAWGHALDLSSTASGKSAIIVAEHRLVVKESHVRGQGGGTLRVISSSLGTLPQACVHSPGSVHTP